MATFIGLDGIPIKTSSGDFNMNIGEKNVDQITFGAIHLNNTNLRVATEFWTKIVGMKLRNSTDEIAEFGSESQTLVVVHQTAKSAFKEGYTGLYHYAIHAPNKVEFAKMIQRLIYNNYSFASIDHTMSKSIYLRDPDGILLEFTLETPERFKRVISENGLFMEDTDGTIRGASDALNVKEQLKALPDKNVDVPLHTDTKIGHIHFYVSNLDETNEFYKSLGFVQFNYLLQYKYADVGAGGVYKHRIAMNSWHGVNQPTAPKEYAGLRHYKLIFKSNAKLNDALSKITYYEKKDDGYWLTDPSGNRLCLSLK
ncbi:MAG: VOC family protein [Raineya sp.]|nr:VOC family protein [Raineya sp.]